MYLHTSYYNWNKTLLSSWRIFIGIKSKTVCIKRFQRMYSVNLKVTRRENFSYRNFGILFWTDWVATGISEYEHKKTDCLKIQLTWSYFFYKISCPIKSFLFALRNIFFSKTYTAKLIALNFATLPTYLLDWSRCYLKAEIVQIWKKNSLKAVKYIFSRKYLVNTSVMLENSYFIKSCQRQLF